MTEVTPITKKAVWVNKYLQGYSNFATVSTKELYQKDNGDIMEATGVVDCIYKSGKWYVYDYSLQSLNKLDSNTLSTKNALCIIGKDGIEETNSQADVTENTDTAQSDVPAESDK